MSKIQILSRVIQVIFILMFIATPILYILYWAVFGTEIFVQLDWNMANIPPDSWTSLVNGSLPTPIRFVAFIISLIPIITFMYLYYFLMRLFGLYGRNIIFSMENVTYIRRVGITLLLWQILHPLYQVLLTFTLSINNEPGHRYISATFSTAQARDLIIAVMIIVISWIMKRGVELETEYQLTV